jgi:hypothetical protein
MTPIKNILTCIIILSILFSACKKDKEPVNPDEVRLIAVESKTGNGTSHLDFEYDASGRITHVTSHADNNPPVIIYNIFYNGNEILLVAAPLANTTGTNRDSTRLTLDAGKVIRKVNNRFDEYFPPSTDPQRTYTRDTTLYEYDASGFLTRETNLTWDSTWRNVNNSGTINTSISRSSEIENHILTNGNVVSTSSIVNWSFVTSQGAQTIYSSRSTENNTSYQYLHGYLNKTDFSNAAIINEVQSFLGLPLNKNYKNLPDKVTNSYIERDQNGTIYATNSFSMNYQYTYNSYGFVSTVFDPALPDLKTTFIYNK